MMAVKITPSHSPLVIPCMRGASDSELDVAHWGAKPSLAAVPKVMAACLGSSHRITASAPDSFSFITWESRS